MKRTRQGIFTFEDYVSPNDVLSFYRAPSWRTVLNVNSDEREFIVIRGKKS